MLHSPMERNDYITVAVAFDRHSAALVTTAADLCRRLGKKLALVHAVEPWTNWPTSAPFGKGDPLWNVTQAVETSARDKARSRLDELAGSAVAGSPGLHVLKVVSCGKPLDVIVREANNLGTCLLMVGTDYGVSRLLPSGFSTALSLLVSAPFPVMALDTAAPVKPDFNRLRMLVADDLSRHAEGALDFAFALGGGLKKAEIQHVHVNGLSLESLKAGLAAAAAAAHTPLNEETSADQVHGALLQDLERRLRLRAEAQRDYLEAAGGTYTAQVMTGTVHEQIGTLAQTMDPGVLVFGRHHAYYTKPFFIGRVPFKSMLAQKRPIIVVPND